MMVCGKKPQNLNLFDSFQCTIKPFEKQGNFERQSGAVRRRGQPGRPEPEQKFTDVPEKHWAEPGIRDMTALGVFQGVGSGCCGMNAGLECADQAAVLFRFRGKSREREAGLPGRAVRRSMRK